VSPDERLAAVLAVFAAASAERLAGHVHGIDAGPARTLARAPRRARLAALAAAARPCAPGAVRGVLAKEGSALCRLARSLDDLGGAALSPASAGAAILRRLVVEQLLG
jgi:hypothetical protein